jgi:hypothetical protein
MNVTDGLHMDVSVRIFIVKHKSHYRELEGLENLFLSLLAVLFAVS